MYIFTVITIDFPSFVYRQAGSKNELSEPQFLIRSIRHILHLSSLIYVFFKYIFYFLHFSLIVPLSCKPKSKEKLFFLKSACFDFFFVVSTNWIDRHSFKPCRHLLVKQYSSLFCLRCLTLSSQCRALFVLLLINMLKTSQIPELII